LSIFRNFNTDFSNFLKGLAHTPNEQGFVARNFLLDSGVEKNRAESYEEDGAAARHPDYNTWQQCHTSYFKDKICPDAHEEDPPKKLDPYDIESYPETFRYMDKSSPFIQSDKQLMLVRLVSCDSIARINNISPDQLITCANNSLKSEQSDSPDKNLLNDYLSQWVRARDWRPVFSAYWQDIIDLLPEQADEAPEAWADKLRDRMGLSRHDPIEGHIPIFVFRYPIEILPRFKNIDIGSPLVPPTVLDGGFSPAFCPAPKNMLTGHTVDIGGNPELTPCREVLHPAIKLTAQHLFRVGTIVRPLKMDNLPEYRGWHILAIREHTDTPDFAHNTDGDLL
jgi:hypothetical protein